ncbi:glycosyl hydrolase [Flavobacterium sp.]|uniref:glycosyl hydrolase n=1 Tax=Flavobacterium sp. TaxID=239 RepID=UPI00286D92BE|nr:glycosyl hydrolase [Flavobacterium sp.]
MNKIIFLFTIAATLVLGSCSKKIVKTSFSPLKEGFLNPPDSAKPGVYWYFMDGNISKEAITADLESMKKVGIGNVLFLEVNVGIPRGNVEFMSEEWMNLFTHIVRESERLGITITLGVGPGWTGSGGPWVTGEKSMKHLVYSSVQVSGSENKPIILPTPAPLKPFFGEKAFTPELKQKRLDYYEDVSVLAFPTPAADFKISNLTEKALYYRRAFTSDKNVKPFIPSLANYSEPNILATISLDKIIDVTQYLKPDGTLDWKAPVGNWTIMRFGSRNNGSLTRPAPLPGVGFEADKMDTIAIDEHMSNFTGKLFEKMGIPDKNKQGGLKMLHMDSWEMGAQNWTLKLREEFKKRRGYDPLPFYPVYSGLVVESLEKSERFLWDLRLTSQELVVENHAMHLKKYAKKYNLGFSIEPYDLNPTADMELGAVADVPMCEFWSKGYGFNSSFSVIQAASIAHIDGKKVVAAEAFTAERDAWKQYPGSMKEQGDWAFAGGVNKFVYHTYQHQVLSDNLKPGMTMGPYGVHHDRSQTWWPMVDAYHQYISRCQYILQQGQTVADILYLTPEGAPQVFIAPGSSLNKGVTPDKSVVLTNGKEVLPSKTKDDVLPDRKGYNFDGCAPSQLLKASVVDGKIVFPSGASYYILVLPKTETMTPALLTKIESLVKDGAVIIGNPFQKSPSLVNYPECDKQVAAISSSIWGETVAPSQISKRLVGKGKVYWGGDFSNIKMPELYPNYDATASILREIGVAEDFPSNGALRYTHQLIPSRDIYFVSNKTSDTLTTNCSFRVNKGTPELWNPMTGETRALPDFEIKKGQIEIPLQFEPFESYFIVFNHDKNATKSNVAEFKNFSQPKVLSEINSPWNVAFDPKWGGPENVLFDKLMDWTLRPEEGIKYYSGIAKYQSTFTLPENSIADKNTDLFIDLGEVNNMARIFVNGKDMGVVWTAPFRIKITDAIVAGENKIDIEVANLWPNRLIGDEKLPDDGIKDKQWPDWLINGKPRTSGRYTFTTFKHYKADSPLLKSGLIGPVKIITVKKTK